MGNTIVLKDKDGNVVYPVTDVSLVMGLEEGAITEAIVAWDGSSTPVVANIPAGVVVSYNGTSYTGTLAASASTAGVIYMVATGSNNVYDRYLTSGISGSYAWTNVGNTTIDLSTYATKAELNQLSQKVDDISTGKYYGYYSAAASLPDDVTVPGFAYVGVGPTYTIYNFDGTDWTSTGVTVNQSPIGNEEDIDQNEDGKLQFADRTYDSLNPDGMGYVILRKDKTFAAQVTAQNTIYEIRYNFDLSGDISIPANCKLLFAGGRISGGYIITGNNTAIDSANVRIFDGCHFAGSWSVDASPIEWYGTKAGDPTSVCAATSINELQEICGVVLLGNGRYYATTATTVNLKGKLVGSLYRLRGDQFGTSLEFRSVASDFVGIQIGVADGGVADRIREATLENIGFSLVGYTSVYRSAVLHIGAVGVANIRQCSFTNNNVRNSALSSSEFTTPENYTNYGIVLSGNSEFLRMSDCGAVADIPVYSRSSAVFDFTQITRCGFDAGAYGFASFYGVALSGSDFSSVSMNRGIYGVCWDEPTGNYLNGNISFIGGRIEQLSTYRVDNFLETCSVKITTQSYSYNTKKLDILFSGVFFPTFNAIRIVGDNEVYVTLVACAGLNVSDNVPSIDIYSSPRANIRCLNSPVIAKKNIRLDPTKHTVSGLKINNQQSDSYAGALYDLSILPICPLSAIRNQQHVHFVAANNRQYDVRLEQTLPTGLTYPFIDRIKLWDSNNKTVGYILELAAVAPGVLARAKYVVKYGESGGAIDPTTGTISIYGKEGDDIFSSSNNDADKLNIYVGSGAGVSIQLYANNRLGQSIHVVGKLSAFTTEEMF